ncbi:succinyl-:3-ketoacid-coenzyme A transferase mitochondrial precursor [Fusarium napiforme]|uniref:Succinyl-:3-ketoacid-coenzyme A transferase mitochondrial n=1 Tax=Fusarium napiforme TaxID=42672 RepID=A0A8H5IHN3_9HYPO|nr:succinyl-:3-ketoacid-coenzyme A transferase mitochondrial precursor [Fusarium napiforme]
MGDKTKIRYTYRGYDAWQASEPQLKKLIQDDTGVEFWIETRSIPPMGIPPPDLCILWKGRIGTMASAVLCIGSRIMVQRGTHVLLTRHFSISVGRYGINKVVSSTAEALKDIKPNTAILCGGFGLFGVPDTLINEVLIASYIGENKTFEKMHLTGDIELELTPQGTLAERCAAAGKGIPAFYTPASVGTVVQNGDLPSRNKAIGSSGEAQFPDPKDVKVFDGKPYLLERSISGAYAFVKAFKADTLGNCQFRLAAQNLNGPMGRNAKVTIVEAEHIFEPGEIPPESVHFPGIYVKRVVQSTTEKGIEKYTWDEQDVKTLGQGEVAAKRERIVRRAAKEFKNGMYANLGIGMPMLAASFVGPDVDVQLQSENGSGVIHPKSATKLTRISLTLVKKQSL